MITQKFFSMGKLPLSGGGKVIDVSNTGLYTVGTNTAFTFQSGTNIIGTSASSIIQESGSGSSKKLTCNKDVFLSLGCIFSTSNTEYGYTLRGISAYLTLYINSLVFTIAPCKTNSSEKCFPSISLPLPAGTTIKTTTSGSYLYYNCSLSLLV